MAKRPPERYNPGDLDRTRNNLGDLSREEAERMATVLGGEIGVEKTDDELRQRYDKLRKTSSTRSFGHGNNAAGSDIKYKQRPGTDKSRSTDTYSGHYLHKKASVKHPGYFDRIKIDRIAARPEHRIKTKSDVLSAYLSFLVKKKDTVNPVFITEGDRFYYSHIEKLVVNLKSLLKQVNPLIFKNYMNPFYRDLLKILISWDLKALCSNLADLQKSPRNREVKDCGNLCAMIYRPIVSTTEIDIKYFYDALDRLYKILLLVHSEDPEELVSIKNKYLDVKESIKIVFKDIAFTCYPLLLKLTGSKFHFYREFINKKRPVILDYLKLDDSDLIKLPDDLQSVLQKQYTLNHLKQTMEKQRQELLDRIKSETIEHDEKDISASIELLENLFPESGWKKYMERPDFYPYFQPLFKFPKGTELIASEDPLQQVIVLAAIIQDLLYGFRSIKISSKYGEIIEKTTDKWHVFIDEMIQNSYNKMLIEYCRNIEKGTDYTIGKFGQKLLTDIYWFKRKFILPFLKFKVLYKSDTIPVKAPKFYEQTGKFYRVLHSLMEDFDKSETRQSVIENYNSKFHFEISNITSYRLKKVLSAENIAPTNENLLRYTLMIVSVLDFLINSENSPYYQEKADEFPVYRYDPVYQGKPLYSTPVIDTATLLKKYQ